MNKDSIKQDSLPRECFQANGQGTLKDKYIDTKGSIQYKCHLSLSVLMDSFICSVNDIHAMAQAIYVDAAPFLRTPLQYCCMMVVESFGKQ